MAHGRKSNSTTEIQNKTNPRRTRRTIIRVSIAIETVKAEFELLRMRLSDKQRKVIDLDEQINTEMKKKTSGKILDA